MKQAVKIFPINSKNEILLQLRDNKLTISYPDFWGSLGGEIEEGETLLEALEREIKEEINSEVTNIKFLGTFILDEGIYEPCKLFIYKGKIQDFVENIKINEGQKVGFFKFEDIENLKMNSPLKNFILGNKEKIFN